MEEVDFEKSEARNIAARNESLYRHNGELLRRITELETAIRELRKADNNLDCDPSIEDFSIVLAKLFSMVGEK